MTDVSTLVQPSPNPCLTIGFNRSVAFFMLLVMGRADSLPFNSCGVLTSTCLLSMSIDSSCRKCFSEGSQRHIGLHCPSLRGMIGLFSGDSGVEGVLYMDRSECHFISKCRFLGNWGGARRNRPSLLSLLSSLCVSDLGIIFLVFPLYHIQQTPRDCIFHNSQPYSKSGYFSEKDKGVVNHHKAFQTAVFSLQSQG